MDGVVEPPTDRDEAVGSLMAGTLRFADGVNRLPADIAVVVVIVCPTSDDDGAAEPGARETGVDEGSGSRSR